MVAKMMLAAPRSYMRAQQIIDFPKGSDLALQDLDEWLAEFDRVVHHVSGGRGVMAEDRISHMLAAWPAESLVGENMRLDQRKPAYKQLEASGKHEECWAICLIG